MGVRVPVPVTMSVTVKPQKKKAGSPSAEGTNHESSCSPPMKRTVDPACQPLLKDSGHVLPNNHVHEVPHADPGTEPLMNSSSRSSPIKHVHVSSHPDGTSHFTTHHSSRESPAKHPPAHVDSVPWLRRQFSMKENTNHYLKNIRLHR